MALVVYFPFQEVLQGKCFTEQSHLSQGTGSRPALCSEPTQGGTARGRLCAGDSVAAVTATRLLGGHGQRAQPVAHACAQRAAGCL